MADIICPDKRPQMGTVRPGVFRKAEFDPSKKGEMIDASHDIRIAPEHIRTKLLEHVDVVAEAVNLEDADVIVAGGRGIGSADNIRLLDALAEATGGTVACSRPVAEAGWMNHSRQVGQSGKTVSPSIYFAIGISGAVQHTAGMKGAGTIIAVNSDPDAPIFDIADYGIVGDLNTIVPALTEKFRARKK